MPSNGNSSNADIFLKFVRKSSSPFHAVQECRKILISSGFFEISETSPWNLKPNGKYFFTRNFSTLVAFSIGGKYIPGNEFSIISAHSDFPCLKLKPVSKKRGENYVTLGVQVYGEGLWHTWFDRDLGISGRVLVDRGDGKLEHHLVCIDRPVLRIPSSQVQLEPNCNDLQFNKETQLIPILATTTKGLTLPPQKKYNHPEILLNMLSEDIGCDIDGITDIECCLHDVNPATLGGALDEFIFSPRLDNLMMVYCSLMALVHSSYLETEENVRVVALCDNEEVGGKTGQGADSSILSQLMKRVSAGLGNESRFDEAIHKSFLINADMAHAINPNYSDKHDENHQPKFHKGVAIRYNANQRFATNSVTSFILKKLAEKKSVPLQEYVIKNDVPYIGPTVTGKPGLRTIDCGNPMLSMHSIREMACTEDIGNAMKLFESFYENFVEIDKALDLEKKYP